MLRRPIISEKSVLEASSRRYLFEVGLLDNKTQIARDVEKAFGVKVLKVATSIRHGKTKRVGKSRTVVKNSDWKVAYVSIDPKQKIDLFEISDSQEAPKAEAKTKEKKVTKKGKAKNEQI